MTFYLGLCFGFDCSLFIRPIFLFWWKILFLHDRQNKNKSCFQTTSPPHFHYPTHYNLNSGSFKTSINNSYPLVG